MGIHGKSLGHLHRTHDTETHTRTLAYNTYTASLMNDNYRYMYKRTRSPGRLLRRTKAVSRVAGTEHDLKPVYCVLRGIKLFQKTGVSIGCCHRLAFPSFFVYAVVGDVPLVQHFWLKTEDAGEMRAHLPLLLGAYSTRQ